MRRPCAAPRLRLLGTPLLVAIVAACASAPNAELVDLRAQVERAAASERIAGKAPVELHEARKSLERAEQAWERNRDEAEVAHLAYLASRRLAIARAAAAASEDRAEARRLTGERGEVLLNARTREVGLALQAAEAARREAQVARDEAEQRSLEAARAEREAEQLSREAAQARVEAEAARREARELAEQEQRLREALAELEARPTDRGMVLTLGDVLFAFDRSDLQPGARQSLDRLVRFLGEYPDRELLIEGHTDDVGAERYNAELSQARADAVKAFLEGQGVRGERVVATGLGEQFPVASNATAEGRQRNRRVEVVILDPGERAAEQRRW